MAGALSLGGMPARAGAPFRNSLPPRDYFTDEIRRQLSQQFGEDEFFTGGLQIRATMDPELQKVAAGGGYGVAQRLSLDSFQLCEHVFHLLLHDGEVVAAGVRWFVGFQQQALG